MMMIRFILLCVLAVSLALAQECTETGECSAIDDKCPDREHIARCAGAHLDTNGNGKLDREELDKAISKLPWYGRGIVKILGSTDKMMKKCDVDGDDAIRYGDSICFSLTKLCLIGRMCY